MVQEWIKINNTKKLYTSLLVGWTSNNILHLTNEACDFPSYFCPTSWQSALHGGKDELKIVPPVRTDVFSSSSQGLRYRSEVFLVIIWHANFIEKLAEFRAKWSLLCFWVKFMQQYTVIIWSCIWDIDTWKAHRF